MSGLFLGTLLAATGSADGHPHPALFLIPLAILLVSLPLVLLAMWHFDRLVYVEFEEFPDAWGADGSPHPLLWRNAALPRTFLSSLATQRCMFVWLFVTPQWAVHHTQALRHLRRMRVAVVLWNLVAMPLFALSAIMITVMGS